MQLKQQTSGHNNVSLLGVLGGGGVIGERLRDSFLWNQGVVYILWNSTIIQLIKAARAVQQKSILHTIDLMI